MLFRLLLMLAAWNRVSVVLTTHDAGGVTELDLALATVMQQLMKRTE